MSKGLVIAIFSLGLCAPVLAVESPIAAPNDE